MEACESGKAKGEVPGTFYFLAPSISFYLTYPPAVTEGSQL